jgi:hypothetical protein
LRDNDSNLGGLAIWHGIGRMDRKDQFEAEAIAAVSDPLLREFDGNNV